MTEHTYIFHNTSDRTIHLLIEPFGHGLSIKPGEMFSCQHEGVPPLLQKLYNQGDLDYWVSMPIETTGVYWQKEGF